MRSGLDFWFTPEGAKAKLPTKWKQFLVTWSAIFPLVLAMTALIDWLTASFSITLNHHTQSIEPYISCGIDDGVCGDAALYKVSS